MTAFHLEAVNFVLNLALTTAKHHKFKRQSQLQRWEWYRH